MPGPVCKVIIDSARADAAAAYYTTLTAGTAKMVTEAILRGVLRGDDPRVAQLNERLCYFSAEQEEWAAELLKLATDIATSAPLEK